MLELTNLRKHYGDVAALDGLSLVARPGRILGFLGPNGSGKTTTMRAVFGLVRLEAGDVAWQSRPIVADDLRRFGYMPEQRGLYPRMRAGDQLVYLARLHGLDRDAATRAASRWLDRLGLGDRGTDMVSALSHGNQQRVQLAASLVHDPDLLVLDEPFSGLDPIGVDAMSQVLRDRAEAGATVVFSSHQLDLVEELCDDVVIVAAGRDRAAGTLDEVRSSATHRRVDVRLAGGADVAVPDGARVVARHDGAVRLEVPTSTDPRELLRGLSHDDGVERFSFGPPTLSELFRQIVGISVAQAEAEHVDDATSVTA